MNSLALQSFADSLEKYAFETTQAYRGPHGKAYTAFYGNRPGTMTMAPPGTPIRASSDGVPGYEALVEETDPERIRNIREHVDTSRTQRSKRKGLALGAGLGSVAGLLGAGAIESRIGPGKLKGLLLAGGGTFLGGLGGAILGRELAPTRGNPEITQEDINRMRSSEVVGSY